MLDPIPVLRPYPGLRPFEPHEAEIFFGREGHVDRLLEILQRERFLAVIGPSGSGKSSLVRAGLLPALAAGWLGTGSDWRLALMRPGDRPLRRLAEALLDPDALGRELLTDSGSRGDAQNTRDRLLALLRAELKRGPRGLVEILNEARRQPAMSARTNLLVLVDQFEELFRYSERGFAEADESEAFVDLLLRSRADDPRVSVVITMRTDFLGQCTRFLELPDAINRAQYLTPRLSRDQIGAAIAGPARVFQGDVDPRLVNDLVNAIANDSDQLPILQDALSQIWENAPEPRLTREHLARVGTIERALDRHAENIFGTLDSSGRRLAETLFRQITERSTSENSTADTRRPQRLGQIAAASGETWETFGPVVEAFSGEGVNFITFGKPLGPDSRVDISHEAVIRLWERLRGWVLDEADRAASYRRWRERVDRRHEGEELLRGTDLDRALEWLDGRPKTSGDDAAAAWRPTAEWARRYAKPGGEAASEFQTVCAFIRESERERKRLVDEEAAKRQREVDREREQLEAATAAAEAREELARQRAIADQARAELAVHEKEQSQWAAAILVTLLVIGGLLFYLFRKESARAESNLLEALVAKRAVYDLLSSAGSGQAAREAADVPQMEEFRRDLLAKAKDFYDKLTTLEPSNEELRNEGARAHTRLGDINRLLERHEEAVREYTEAINRFEKLATDYPGKPEYPQALAYSYNWLGETLRLWLRGSLKVTRGSLTYTRSDAAKAYDNALRLQQKLHGGEPANSDYQQELARTYYNRGILRYDSGLLGESEADFRESIRLLEPLPDKKTNPPPFQDLARAYSNLGNLLRGQEKPAEAREYFERAVETHERLREKEPLNREYKLELAWFYDNLALLLLDQRQLDLAKRRNRQALDLFEELVSPAPSLDLQRANALNHGCQILGSEGSREAETFCQRSMDILETLEKNENIRNRPDFPVLLRDLGYNYRVLAQNRLESGSLAAAQGALERLSRLLPRIPEPDRSTLIKDYQKLRKELRDRVARHK